MLLQNQVQKVIPVVINQLLHSKQNNIADKKPTQENSVKEKAVDAEANISTPKKEENY